MLALLAVYKRQLMEYGKIAKNKVIFLRKKRVCLWKGVYFVNHDLSSVPFFFLLRNQQSEYLYAL